MLLTLFILILFQFLLLAGAFLYARSWLKRQFTALFIPPSEGQPSQFGIITATIADQLSTSMVTRLKTTFMGIQSGEAKRERKEAQAGFMDVISAANPLAGAIAGQYPGVVKMAMKNPELAQWGLNMLSKIGGQAQGGQPAQTAAPSNGHGSSMGIGGI